MFAFDVFIFSCIVGNDNRHLQIYLNYFHGVYIRKEDLPGWMMGSSIGYWLNG